MDNGTHYQPGATGWVVQATKMFEGQTHPLITYWYGPDSGWGTTSGGLDYSARVWATKKAATAALRSIFGTTPKGYRVIRVSEAEAERASR